MKDCIIEDDYNAMYNNENPLQLIQTNIKNPTTRRPRTTEKTRQHAEFIRNVADSTEDFPLAQVSQQHTRRTKQGGIIAYSFKDALIADNTTDKKHSQHPTPTTMKKIQSMVNQAMRQTENPKIPNSILLNEHIKEQITIQLSDMLHGGKQSQITEKQIKKPHTRHHAQHRQLLQYLGHINRKNKKTEGRNTGGPMAGSSHE
jgi:hypothetical protein